VFELIGMLTAMLDAGDDEQAIGSALVIVKVA
jgi:hypothetical protein